jgi:exopolyphosphatase/guanosine-5'-triphosphate,3'-diphosphate pyrophosphatase
MSTEVEAKFIVPDRTTYDRVRALRRLGSCALLEARVQEVHDEYLDTPDRTLLAAGYACRRRELGGTVIMTLKSVLSQPGEVHRREELEVSLPTPASARIPVSGWPASAARSKVQELAGTRALQVLFHLDQRRIVRDVVDAERVTAAASLDEVSLSMPGGSPQQWWELELELAEAGTEADLHSMSAWVRAALGLRTSPISKFERALKAIRER